MEITFHGAVREVTGSAHLITSGKDKILLDCGMFQGRRKESAQKNKKFPFDPNIITNVILSHAHIDHAGRIPLLSKLGFSGSVICTRATADICDYLLHDSAKIQESDAAYLNYKTARSHLYRINKISSKNNKKIEKIIKRLKSEGHHLDENEINRVLKQNKLKKVKPLYTTSDVENALSLIESYPYKYRVEIGKEMTSVFYEAGHVLGSAVTIIKSKINGSEKSICYTGDLGRPGKPILKDPELVFDPEDKNIDLMIMESTYGNRLHHDTGAIRQQLKEAIIKTFERGGTVLIPSFAFGRTQEIIYTLHELYDQKELPKLPIYIDSPLAINLTKVFGEHPEVYDRDTHKTFLEKKKKPFLFHEINFTSHVEDSIKLMKEKEPHIVIASSGMCEAGRILHHLRYKIHDEKNTILIVGYMAENTLGRKILEKGIEFAENERKSEVPILKILNKTYPLYAEVISLEGFSAHADKDELTDFLKKSNLNIKKIAVVHGEEKQSLTFAEHLRKEKFDAFVPNYGDTISL